MTAVVYVAIGALLVAAWRRTDDGVVPALAVAFVRVHGTHIG